MKLWTPQGLVLYSDEKRLIGQRFALDDDAVQALTVPQTQAGITDSSRPENAYEFIRRQAARGVPAGVDAERETPFVRGVLPVSPR